MKAKTKAVIMSKYMGRDPAIAPMTLELEPFFTYMTVYIILAPAFKKATQTVTMGMNRPLMHKMVRTVGSISTKFMWTRMALFSII